MHQLNKMILIVDDSYLIIERIKDMLSEIMSMEMIMHAHTYTDAVEILNKTLPDIILLDINLPDINGIELLRLIKETYPAIAVVMLTNQGGDYYRQLCNKIGANHFIDKSTDFELIPEILINLY